MTTEETLTLDELAKQISRQEFEVCEKISLPRIRLNVLFVVISMIYAILKPGWMILE